VYKRQEIVVMGAVGKSGKPFNVKGKLTEQVYKGKKFVGFENMGFVNDDGSDRDPNEGYATGVWNGRDVRFKASWSGHAFTDGEIADLLAGKEIKVIGAVGKSGKPFNAKGSLADQTFNGRKFVGFKCTGFLNDDGSERDESSGGSSSEYCEGTWKRKKIRFKRSWGGYRFTDKDCETLLAGGEISFPAKGKSGNDFTAVGKLEEQEFNGRKFIGFKPDFGKRG